MGIVENVLRFVEVDVEATTQKKSWREWIFC